MLMLRISCLLSTAFLLALLLSSSARAGMTGPRSYSEADLLGMAANTFASGELPLGDNRYLTTGPRKGYIYLCHAPPALGGGAWHVGDWIHGSDWSLSRKISIQGQVSWEDAHFSITTSDDLLRINGNGLPINHTTGSFPIQPSDPAYQYDRNPNKISAQNIDLTLPATPDYASTPFCMGMEVGVMLSGVPLFNGFDADLRDAAAHELQDSCGGHPERSGQYHYHNLSPCFRDISVKTILGYALDGFPITGPLVGPGRYLTTANLDECHGLTSEITENTQPKMTYHYVMTQDFPYSVSCFRGKPVRLMIAQHGGNGAGQPPGPPHRQGGPPAEALAVCKNQSNGSPCVFSSPHGMVSGTCQAPPDHPLACTPNWSQ